MALPIKKSDRAIKWVLNKIQASNNLEEKKSFIFYFENVDKNDVPSVLEQGKIIKFLVKNHAIWIEEEFFHNIISLKKGRRENVPDGAPISILSGGTIVPTSIRLKILDKKFNELLIKYDDKMIAYDDSVNYNFNKNNLKGNLIIGEENITFDKGRGILVNYFFINRNKLGFKADFESYKKYLLYNDFLDNNFKIKLPDNKKFRVMITKINSRVENKFKNIENIITLLNPHKEKGRNEYKWEIKFT